MAEVIARGVFLPEGKLECLTCHDPGSPWRYHLALPPGTRAAPAVNPRDRSTYVDGPARAARERSIEVPAAGERPAVSPKPLCLACHAVD
jgi:hypothetical protein